MMDKETVNGPAIITMGWEEGIFVYISLLFKVLGTKTRKYLMINVVFILTFFPPTFS